MKTIRTAVAAAALVAALVGCGAPVAGTPAAQPAPPPPTTTPPPDPAADRRAIETVFQDYYNALQTQDFATACSLHAPETTDQMLAKLRSRGIEAAACEDGMTAVYALPDTARVVELVAETAKVDDVTITGDVATLKWSSEVNGKRSPGTTQLRRVDGRWLLASTGT
jgi:ketosteroid isomerase-like protein